MKISFHLLLFLCISNFTNSQSLNSGKHIEKEDSIQIAQVLMLQQKGWNEGNLENYMEGYLKSDSLMFISKKGITLGWKNTLEHYQKSYPDKTSMGTLQFNEIQLFYLSEDKILMTGKWTLFFQNKDSVGGYYSLIWKKFNHQWNIVVDHTS